MRILPVLMLCLAACSSVVPTTAMRLGGVSPATADPAGFAVSLDLPEGADVQAGTARLLFTVTRSDTGVVQSGAFTLDRMGPVFQIAAADLDRLRDLQATAQSWEAEAPNATRGSLSITLAPCVIGAGPASDAVVSADVRLVEGGPFLPLLRKVPLATVTGDLRPEDVPTCP